MWRENNDIRAPLMADDSPKNATLGISVSAGFCLSLLGIISSYFGNIVACYQRFVVSDIGYSLKLYRTDGNAIPPNVIQQISHIKGVIGCNQEANMLVQPVNFANAIPDSEDNLFDIPESDMVRLYADSNTALNLSLQITWSWLKVCFRQIMMLARSLTRFLLQRTIWGLATRSL